jgi:hypothetical protein
MEFCRNSCINLKNDNFSNEEKSCIKNCTYKYLEQFSVFNTFKESFEQKFGTNIFLFDHNHKKTLHKLIELIKMNQQF